MAQLAMRCSVGVGDETGKGANSWRIHSFFVTTDYPLIPVAATPRTNQG